ncbi:hypothetical protein B0H11DRAFT_2273092, partial [Mycena galericulata]
MSPTEAPLLLGHICSAWRSIAFALPRLWSSLHICTEFVYPDTMQVSNWLARSGTSPLVLSVKCAENAWQNKHVLWALEKVSNRWRTVEICDIYAQEFIEHLADADAPLLHDIKITFRVDTEPLTVESGILGSSVLMGSNMQSVGVSTRSLGHLIPWEPFVWGHLLHLTLSPTNSDNHNHLPLDTGLALLKGCPRLQSIRFHLNGRFQPSYADVLLLPCLESMIILDESFIIPEFYSRIPCIFLPDADVLPVSLFQDLVERSPGIVHLGICLSHFSRESLLGTLRLFPALTTLSAVDHRFADTNLLSILALNSAATSQALFPALTEFSRETYQMDLWTALRNAVDHRSSLRRLKIEFRRRAPEILPDIQPLISLGLDVIIKYSPISILLLSVSETFNIDEWTNGDLSILVKT